MKKALSLILAMIMLASVITGCTTLKGNDKGAIIDMYITTEVLNFDPQASITDDAMLKINSLIYEGLTTIDQKGKWQKALMKDYEIETDKDGEFSILVYLNNTRWSDGRTVQAADFVYSWKRLINTNNKHEAACLLYEIKNAYDVKMGDASIDDLGVAAVDTYTLQIQFEQKVDLDQFFENCSSIALVPLREDVVSRYTDEYWAAKSTNIVTNGPFAVKGMNIGEELRLERSGYYYLDAEKNEPLDKFVIPYRLLTEYDRGDAEAQMAAFEEGKLFYIDEIPLSARADYKGKATVTDMMTTHTYLFNTNNELFADADVRRALSMAIDRDQIVNIVTFAKAATGYVPYKVFNSTTGTSFREAGGAILSTTADLAGAKSLLSKAGVNGGEFTLTVRNNEVDLAIAEYVAGVWEDLGFDVTIDTPKATESMIEEEAFDDNFQKIYDEGTFDVIAIDMNMLSTDAFSALAQFAVPFSGNGVDMYSENYDLYTHVTGYANEEYNALIASAFAEKDRAKRAELLHQAEEMLLQDMPVVPLVFLQDAYLTHKDLSKVKTTYYGVRDFRDTKLKNYMKYKAATDTTEDAEK
ncbi:MAG: peptide ABC transporter substrate-binding protein [Clostridia bacterium]|nr:peptide ABC transporter substrate-binding protein [Clostridia bacterium]